MSTSVAEWLAAFVRMPRFLAKYPYYASVLAKLVPAADPSIRRMAVSLYNGRFYLHVNVDAFVSEPEYIPGILLHEVHHVVLGHLTHPKFRDVSYEDLMELCMEMSANEYIDEPLPDPIVWQAFKAYGIRAEQSTVERYEILAALRRQNAIGEIPKPDTVDDHGPWQHSPPPPGAAEQARALLQDALHDATPEHVPIPLPKYLRLAGKDPGRLLEALTGTHEPPRCVMDWKTALRMFVVRTRAPVHTYSRPNRRHPTRVGEVPGRTYAPRALVRPHLLIAIDTSTSMAPEDLAEVARQLTRISEYARVTVAECDTEIERVYPFEGTVQEMQGRGGTDLRPVFSPEFLGSIRPDGIVYFTDGEGPFPETPPAVATLWILTKALQFPCPWGERTELLGRVGSDKCG